MSPLVSGYIFVTRNRERVALLGNKCYLSEKLATMENLTIYDNVIASLFERFPELNVQQVAKGMNINPALMRQYVGGKKRPSFERLMDIENYLHKLGEELQKVHL